MDVLKLRAVLGLDKSEYDSGLEDAESGAYKAGQAIGSAMKTSAKVAMAGIGVAAAGIGALVKSSVDAYADYEQLIGGVETLFKDSAGKVEEYANNAYKTAGLSANEYMETVTGFSAALLQSLGGDTAKAAEVADMAITDMADNANKMGTSMESIQTAYQGFAKQNYTMLDNLKLGYGGTKEEMERLLEDAEKISGIEYDISSYADIVDAIHVVQDEMGITGTTAQEAEKTIAGSVEMLKSSWQNLITGIASGNADLSGLIDNVVQSAKSVVENVKPVIHQALTGIGELIHEVVPIIAEELPPLINDLLPLLLESATNLFIAFAEALPTLIQVLVDQLPTIIQSLIDAFVALAPQLITVGITLILGLAQGLIQAIPQLIAAIPQIIVAIVAGLISAIPQLLQAGIQLIGALIQGILSLVTNLPSTAKTIVETLISALIDMGTGLIEVGGNLVNNLISGIANLFGAIFDAGAELVSNVGNGVKSLIGNAITWGKDLIGNFINGIKSMAGELWDTIKGIASGIKDFLGFSEPKLGPLSNFHTYAPDMMDLFMQGVNDKQKELQNTVAKAFDFQDIIESDVNVNSTTKTSNNNDLYGMLETIIAMLPNLGNMQVVLDTGALVGQTVGAYDVALGQLYTDKTRSV